MTEAPPSICGGIMTSKHPKRCSNHCVHETKSPFLYGWGCNAVRDDEGRPINITVVEERLINEIGCALYSNHLELPDSCASHSSASEPPEICCKCEDTPDVCGSDRIRCERAQAASEAREKVLDEALAEFQNINAPPVRVTYIRHVLESLRQQEGKP
jgi:hypothetical protein